MILEEALKCELPQNDLVRWVILFNTGSVKAGRNQEQGFYVSMKKKGFTTIHIRTFPSSDQQ